MLLRVFAEVILQVIAVQMQIRRCTGAKVESRGGAEVVQSSGPEVQWCSGGAEVQWCSGVERYRDAEVQVQ